MKYLGFVSAKISFNSSRQACPETCTSANVLYITDAPILKSSLITFATDFSFPGIGVADIITKSFLVISTFLWSENAILVSALIGSPWLPVVIITIFSGGYLFMLSRFISTPSGIFIYPKRMDISTIFSILLPETATFLPFLTAAFIIC